MNEQIKGLAYVEGFVTAMAAVLQDREWVDGKVGNITLTTAEVKKLLRSVMTHIGCDENELRGFREENKLLTERIEEMRIASKPVTAENPVCDAWHKQGDRAECWAVKERSECTCGGDKNKCDFYGG